MRAKFSLWLLLLLLTLAPVPAGAESPPTGCPAPGGASAFTPAGPDGAAEYLFSGLPAGASNRYLRLEVNGAGTGRLLVAFGSGQVLRGELDPVQPVILKLPATAVDAQGQSTVRLIVVDTGATPISACSIRIIQAPGTHLAASGFSPSAEVDGDRYLLRSDAQELTWQFGGLIAPPTLIEQPMLVSLQGLPASGDGAVLRVTLVGAGRREQHVWLDQAMGGFIYVSAADIGPDAELAVTVHKAGDTPVSFAQNDVQLLALPAGGQAPHLPPGSGGDAPPLPSGPGGGTAAPLIRLQVDSSTAYANGQPVILEAPPVIDNGRTLVPVRFLTESLGATVDWVEDEQKVVVRRAEIRMEFWIGQAEAQIGDRLVPLATAPRIVNGRMLVPLRVVAETLGAWVDWIPFTREIWVTGQT